MKSSRFVKSVSPVFRLVFILIFLGLQAAFPLSGNLGDAQAAPAPDPGLAPVMETGQPEKIEPRPLLAATPSLGLSVPSTAMLGEEFTFTATFDNTGADPGYGPFMDIVLPATGADGVHPGTTPGVDEYDGVSFVGASFLGSAIPADQITVQSFPDDGGGFGCVQHPVAVRPANDPPPPGDTSVPRYYDICGVAGDTLVTIILPFGSFVPSQPPAAVTITAEMSDLADLNTLLGIRGQAGFQFGETPIQDFCCSPYDATIPVVPGGEYDTSGWSPSNIEPALMTLTKEYVGPENETATGPNYPRQFTITVDIADGQRIGVAGDGAQNLVITDDLPDNIQYLSLDSSTPSGASCTEPSTTTPGGTLSCSFDSVLGGAGANDATLTFSYYVDRLDASSGEVVNSSTGAPNTSNNTADVEGAWEPIDGRDDTTPLPTATATCGTPCVGVEDQSIVVQKDVGVANDVSPTGNTPGDTLEYTLDFQVSDFFGFQDIVLTDVISDGQRFDTTFTPTLNFSGNPASRDFSGAFAPANYVVDNSDIGNDTNPATGGTQTVT
ncbi:MAG: hypothetical protein B5M51_06745, partial [Anaerolinea sp. 4484_236]